MTAGPSAWAEATMAAALLAVDPALGGAVVRAPAGPVRDAWLAALRGRLPAGAPWRRLPPGVDDSRLLGGLDLGSALGAGRRVLQRGLLAEADGGVLVAPMAERLGSGLAGRLAAALDEGAVALERDGLAARLDARFLLIGLDEGVEPEEQPDEALTDRLAFHLDLSRLGPRDTDAAAPFGDVEGARAALSGVAPLETAEVEALCGAAQALGVDSLRAPLLAARAARASAALHGRTEVRDDDLAWAAQLVLAPRARHAPQAPEEPADPAAPSEADSGDDRDDAPMKPGDQPLADRVLAAAEAALPEGLAALWAARAAAAAARQSARGAGPARRAPARGRPVGVRAGLPRSPSALSIVDTLKAAAPWQRLRKPAGAERLPLRVRRDDLRVRRFEQRSESTVIFVVDASGSAALHRLAEAKGAVELLLAEAYVRRTQVALVAFRGATAELLLPATRSLARARRCLAELAGGGSTPLATALEAGATLAAVERAKGRAPLLVVLTDGRGNIALDGAAFRTRAETDAMSAARRVRAAGVPAALIDTSPRPRGEGARLAEAMGARYAPLPYVEAGAVGDLARALTPLRGAA